MLTLDIEVYPNYNLFAFKKIGKDEITTFETWDKYTHKQIKKIDKLLHSTTIITFNGITFDVPMVLYALRGADVDMMYTMCHHIITKRSAAYMTYRKMGVEEDPTIDHIDLIEPAPAVMVSLKLYGSRMGSKKLWDLPYLPDTKLSKKKAANLKKYCGNDLVLTEDLYIAIKDRIELRIKMSKKYGVDLRSKSDAQIAEVVICHELGFTGKAPKIPKNYTFKYKAPKYLKFKTPQLKELLKLTQTLKYSLSDKMQVNFPKEFKILTIGNSTYKMGIGGLHSQEKSLVCKKDMQNADYASYYPRIILNNKYYPKHLGKKFLKVFSKIVDERLAGKEIDAKGVVAMGLKIVINGAFGKFGSQYSKLFSPDLLIHTTITGQLTLLMLIEQFEAAGITVISSNTDGIEYSTTKTKKAKKIIKKLDAVSGHTMEIGSYKGLYARDVNNYVADYGDYVKAKGVYCNPLDPENFLKKNTQVPICFEAVRQYILKGTPIKKTIKKCKDVKQFLAGTQVKGGAYFGTPIRGEREKIITNTKVGYKWVIPFLGFDDESYYLGKVVRWYYSTNGKSIHRQATGNKVPLSDGVIPMMTLKKKIPKDLNYNYYYDYANRMLKDLG